MIYPYKDGGDSSFCGSQLVHEVGFTVVGECQICGTDIRDYEIQPLIEPVVPESCEHLVCKECTVVCESCGTTICKSCAYKEDGRYFCEPECIRLFVEEICYV